MYFCLSFACRSLRPATPSNNSTQLVSSNRPFGFATPTSPPLFSESPPLTMDLQRGDGQAPDGVKGVYGRSVMAKQLMQAKLAIQTSSTHPDACHLCRPMLLALLPLKGGSSKRPCAPTTKTYLACPGMMHNAAL